jgi:hypothetical protein
MEKGLMSVVVILGFKTEDQVTTAHNPVGDEFDHMAGLARLERPFELIVVDRAWPDRQHRMEEVFGARCRWRYIPPRPSEWVKRGMWSVSCSMNSGAICSVGELLVMSGDFNVFKADQFAFIYDGWFKQRKLYQPVVDFIWGNFQIPEKEEPIVGLNVGPRVLTRAMFWLLNGWDGPARPDQGDVLAAERLGRDVRRDQGRRGRGLRRPDRRAYQSPGRDGEAESLGAPVQR